MSREQLLALGKPADRYSNSRATYVNPITNIFPCLTARSKAMWPEGAPYSGAPYSMNNFGPTIRTRTSSSTSTIGDLRTIERKEKRAIEHQIFLEISSSYLVFLNRNRTRARPRPRPLLFAGQGECQDAKAGAFAYEYLQAR